MDLLAVRSLPFLTRRNYFYEFKHIILWSVPAGLIEGRFASVVVAKTFDGSDTLIAIAAATPIAALLFSLIWGMLSVGRPKIRLLTLFAAGTTLCAGAVAAIPNSPFGTIWFIAQMATAQVLLAGVVTIRSAVWKSNYPRASRGRITARLQKARVAVRVVTVLLAGWICGKDPQAYRYLYPAAALVGGLSIYLLRHLHMRGERSELRRHGSPPVDGDVRKGYVEPFSLTALVSPGHVLGQMIRVLRGDRRFLRYCSAQMLLGVGNQMTLGIAVAVVTRELRQEAGWDFWISTTLLIALPQLMMLGTMSRWARVLDRSGVVRLRVINTGCWCVALSFGMLGTICTQYSDVLGPSFLLPAVTFFALQGLVNGLGFGGGALAWNIGHLHFAKSEDAELYMGVHVSLTGFRGLIAPIGGVWLWAAMGWPVWLIAIALCLASVGMFRGLARHEAESGVGGGSI